MSTITHFGIEFRTRREALGLTQDELAARSGVSQSAVSKIELSRTASTAGRSATVERALMALSKLEAERQAEASDVRDEPEVAVGLYKAVHPAYADDQLKQGIMSSLSLGEYTLDDVDMVRKLVTNPAFYVNDTANYFAMVRTWLNSCGELRREFPYHRIPGHDEPTTVDLLYVTTRRAIARINEWSDRADHRLVALHRAKALVAEIRELTPPEDFALGDDPLSRLEDLLKDIAEPSSEDEGHALRRGLRDAEHEEKEIKEMNDIPF